MAGSPSRRDVLRYGGIALLGAIAGCLGSSGGQSGNPTTDDGGQDGEGDAATLAGHPGAAGLDSQPFLGADPGESDRVIIAFEDPSCPTCARFERQTLPTLKEELLDTETASFVFRGIGIIYDWGEPAAKALEATLARSESAHWALKNQYYAEQQDFDAQNVLSKTEAFLESETDLDGGAVVGDVEDGTADDAYQTDLDASSAVGVSATPTFLLFKDGQYVTSAVGAVSYEVFATALEV